ncbi:MAG: hypothetical protein IPJ67_00665 [Candidatus Moraniibacteriota bacterium]|nr:MAG: hypothetical protein IPJ67_00665 [Candidatus Moranbacteria bacterium]
MKLEQSPSMPKEWLTSEKKHGFSLVEVLLSGAVFSLLVTALVGAYLYGEEATVLAGNRTRAVFFAEEGLEATRNIRDSDFMNLSDGVHGLAISGGQWNFSGSSDVDGIFTRSVTIAPVSSNRKSVTSTVSWQQNAERTGTVALSSYLTNWIVSGIGNWASPLEEASVDASGNADGLKVQYQDSFAYVVRNVGTDNFLVFDVSDSVNPSLVGSLTLAGRPSNISIAGNYAYVSSSDNNEELQIVDISTPVSPSLAGSYNAPGNANVIGVFASGLTAYIVRANSSSDEFLIINVASPTSPSLVGSLNLGANGNEVVVSGNAAYIASSDNSEELKVVNISTPASPSQIGSLNLSGNTDAITIAFTGSTVLLGQGDKLFTVNISTPASPAVLGSVDLSGTVNDIALVFGNANTYVYTATSRNSAEFQVVDISSLASPMLFGSVDVSGNNNLFGIAYDETIDRAFGVGTSNSEEFIVLAPQ